MPSKYIKDSVIYTASTALSAVLAYAFYFIVSKSLLPAEFGTVGSLLSLFFILAVPQSTISLYIAKKMADKKDYKTLFSTTFSTVLITASILFFAIVLLSPLISSFLNLGNALYIVLASFCMVPALLISITRGVLQGKSSFVQLSISIIVESVLKVLVIIPLLFNGSAIMDVFLAMLLSLSIALAYSFFQLKSFPKLTKPNFSIFNHSLPIFFLFLLFTLIINVDVLLVKHYFSSELSGLYAVSSLFGKALYYISLALAFTMFPKVAELHFKKEGHFEAFALSMNLLSILGASVLFAFTAFPAFVVNIMFGKGYEMVASLLPYFAIFSVLVSFCVIISFYLLAQNKKFFIIPMFVAPLLQVFFISLFHSSLISVVKVLISVNLLLILYLLYELFKSKKVQNYITTNS